MLFVYMSTSQSENDLRFGKFSKKSQEPGRETGPYQVYGVKKLPTEKKYNILSHYT